MVSNGPNLQIPFAQSLSKYHHTFNVNFNIIVISNEKQPNIAMPQYWHMTLYAKMPYINHTYSILQAKSFSS